MRRANKYFGYIPVMLFLLILELMTPFCMSQALQFPLFFGGFQGDTNIEGFCIDANQNLLVVVNSNDLSLVSTSGEKILFYLKRDASNYKWAVTLPT